MKPGVPGDTVLYRMPPEPDTDWLAPPGELLTGVVADVIDGIDGWYVEIVGADGRRVIVRGQRVVRVLTPHDADVTVSPL